MHTEGSDDDSKRIRGQKNNVCFNHCLIVVVLAALTCLIAVHVRRTSMKLPQPPEPYEYSAFMSWLRQADFSHASSSEMAWKPEVEEFDLDAVVSSEKWAKHLQGSDGRKAVSIAKHINKYFLYGSLIRYGIEGKTGAPGTHLYAISKLAVPMINREHPTFLDAGCGPGVLLLAWVLSCGSTSTAIGIDVDEVLVDFARKALPKSDALDEQSGDKVDGSQMRVYVGDALQPSTWVEDIGSVPAFDAVNIGVGIKHVAELDALVALMRTGGLLLAPICDPDQPADMPAGKCAGLLRLFEKASNGKLEGVAGDTGVPVRFVLPTKKLPGIKR